MGSRLRPGKERRRSKMLVVCPASEDLMMENVGQQSVEKMILVLKEELEVERDKRNEAEEKANKLSDQLQIEAKEKEAFVKMSYDFESSDKLDLLLENQDLKANLATMVEREMEMVQELEQVKTEKKILGQTVLCEIKSKRRKQRGGEFESIFEELEDFLLKAFFIRPIQGMAPDLVIPVEATV